MTLKYHPVEELRMRFICENPFKQANFCTSKKGYLEKTEVSSKYI